MNVRENKMFAINLMPKGTRYCTIYVKDLVL